MERKLCCRKCLLLGTCPGQVLVDLQNGKHELFISRLWIWIRIKLKGRIRIRIKVISWIRILINLQMTSQNVWNTSLFEHFLNV
jgi:hypothetical protein